MILMMWLGALQAFCGVLLDEYAQKDVEMHKSATERLRGDRSKFPWRPIDQLTERHLADRPKALDHDIQHLGGVAFPPICGTEDLDFAGALVACCFHRCTHRAQISYAVAHHAAVKQNVLGVGQPIAQVLAINPPTGPHQLARQIGVPPDMVDIYRHAKVGAAMASQISSASRVVVRQDRLPP